MIPSIFCKFSVPLFFMIFGALMLKREPEPLSKLWSKRILRMMLLLFIWSFFSYLVEVFWSGTQEFHFKEFVKRFYDSSWNLSYWYLYAYIPMLMTLPLLQRFVKNLTDKDFLYMFFLFFVFTALLPVVQYLLWQELHNLNNHLLPSWLCTNIFIYPCLGYFLQSRFNPDIWNKKRLGLLWFINICTILISCYMTYFKAKITGECSIPTGQGFHSSFVMVNCVSIFITCKYIIEKIKLPQWVNKLILSMGGCTFGIYLMHLFFLLNANWVENLWHIFRNQWHINYMIAALLICGTVFLSGYIITLILKKIPILKNLV
ncbi:MAG: acyltransferase [Lachnospiraceae bacterium]|nr:acyltransferase [Lachnospiraceae bacterium]